MSPAEGAIYDSFSTDLHVINFPPKLPEYSIVGVDYGTNNPCSFIRVDVNRSGFPNMWVADEYYYSSKVHQRQKTDAEYAADLMRFIKDTSVIAIYIDPSATSFKLELRKQGVQNLYDAKNEVLDGIRLVSTYVDSGTLKVCRNCPNLIKEFQSYVWDAKSAKTGEDRPLKENDHALDALRYVMFQPFLWKGWKIKECGRY